MAHAFVKNHIHLVFSTKDRTPSIAKAVEEGLSGLANRFAQKPKPFYS